MPMQNCENEMPKHKCNKTKMNCQSMECKKSKQSAACQVQQDENEVPKYRVQFWVMGFPPNEMLKHKYNKSKQNVAAKNEMPKHNCKANKISLSKEEMPSTEYSYGWSSRFVPGQWGNELWGVYPTRIISAPMCKWICTKCTYLFYTDLSQEEKRQLNNLPRMGECSVYARENSPRKDILCDCQVSPKFYFLTQVLLDIEDRN